MITQLGLARNIGSRELRHRTTSWRRMMRLRMQTDLFAGGGLPLAVLHHFQHSFISNFV